MTFDSAPRHENTNEKPVPTSVAPITPAKKENIFLNREAAEVRELSRLEHELVTLTQQIGAIRAQIIAKTYPGKIGDINPLIDRQDALTKQINNHPRFKKPTIQTNHTGRDARMDRKINN